MSNILRHQGLAPVIAAMTFVSVCAAPFFAAAQNIFDDNWTVENSSKNFHVK
jgi:hypothetical protein